jgi:peptidyl-dipeptidase A
VASPKHLQKLGLITKSIDDAALDINYLFGLAIDQIVFLPYALALESWRWDIFSKAKRKDQFNCHYWFLRCFSLFFFLYISKNIKSLNC